MAAPGIDDPYWDDNDSWKHPNFYCPIDPCETMDTGPFSQDKDASTEWLLEHGYYPAVSQRRMYLTTGSEVESPPESQPSDEEFIADALERLHSDPQFDYLFEDQMYVSGGGVPLGSSISAMFDGTLRSWGDCARPDVPLTAPHYKGWNKWGAGVGFYTIHTKWIYCPDFQCPVNSHLENGYCIADHGWDWCDDSHTATCPHCATLGCIDSDAGFSRPGCYDVGETVSVCFTWNPYDPECDPGNDMEHVAVGLSYGGSLAGKINGPDEVLLAVSDYPYKGCITLTINSDVSAGGNLTITPTNATTCGGKTPGFILEICTVTGPNPIEPPVHPPGSGPGEMPPGDDGSGGGYGDECGARDCCGYMPKDYLAWKDGVGIQPLVAPYKKDWYVHN